MASSVGWLAFPWALSACIFLEHGETSEGTGATGGGTASNSASAVVGSSTSSGMMSGGSGGQGGADCAPYAGVEGLCLIANIPAAANMTEHLAGHMVVTANRVVFATRDPKFVVSPIMSDVACDRVDLYDVPLTHPPGSPVPPPFKTYTETRNTFPTGTTPNRHPVLGARGTKVYVGFQGAAQYDEITTSTMTPIAAHATSFTFVAGKVYASRAPGGPLFVVDETAELTAPPGLDWTARWVDHATVSNRPVTVGIFSRSLSEGGAVCTIDPLLGNTTLQNESCRQFSGYGHSFAASEEWVFAREADLVPPHGARILRFDRALLGNPLAHAVKGTGPISYDNGRLWVVEPNPEAEFVARDVVSCLTEDLLPCPEVLPLAINELRRVTAMASQGGYLYFLADTQVSGASPSRVGLFRYRP